MKNNETKAMQHYVFFLRMVFHLYFSFALKRRWCRQFVVRKFQVKVFGPKGGKFLATKKFVLATKSKNLGASWPQGFFLKSSPVVLKISVPSFHLIPMTSPASPPTPIQAFAHYAFTSPLKCSTLMIHFFSTKMLGLPQKVAKMLS